MWCGVILCGVCVPLTGVPSTVLTYVYVYAVLDKFVYLACYSTILMCGVVLFNAEKSATFSRMDTIREPYKTTLHPELLEVGVTCMHSVCGCASVVCVSVYVRMYIRMYSESLLIRCFAHQTFSSATISEYQYM